MSTCQTGVTNNNGYPVNAGYPLFFLPARWPSARVPCPGRAATLRFRERNFFRVMDVGKAASRSSSRCPSRRGIGSGRPVGASGTPCASMSTASTPWNSIATSADTKSLRESALSRGPFCSPLHRPALEKQEVSSISARGGWISILTRARGLKYNFTNTCA